MRPPQTPTEHQALELYRAGAVLEEIRAALDVETPLDAYERIGDLVPETGPEAVGMLALLADLYGTGFEGIRIARNPTAAERRALELLAAGAGLDELRAALGAGSGAAAVMRLQEIAPQIGPAAARLAQLRRGLRADSE